MRWHLFKAPSSKKGNLTQLHWHADLKIKNPSLQFFLATYFRVLKLGLRCSDLYWCQWLGWSSHGFLTNRSRLILCADLSSSKITCNPKKHTEGWVRSFTQPRVGRYAIKKRASCTGLRSESSDQHPLLVAPEPHPPPIRYIRHPHLPTEHSSIRQKR